MAFDESDVYLKFYSLDGKCECCKKELAAGNRDYGDKGAWHAHHIVPRHIKVDDSMDNMAILCINEPENCHLNQGHGGDYKSIQPKHKWKCSK